MDQEAHLLRLNNIVIKSVYFIGIGGIGMSALVRYFLSKDVHVGGYDLKETDLTKCLAEEGAHIHYEDNVQLISKDADVVIYTPAIPVNHTELAYYRENKYVVVKRSDVLGWITENAFNICVAGSHGKTTVTTMIAYLLRETGYGANAFLGGIAANYDTNFWRSDRNVNVVEADEYDRSFLKLSPDVAIITAMDPDHLDIYGTVQNLEDAYLAFASKLKSGGLLLTKYGLKDKHNFGAEKHLTYSLDNTDADIYGFDIKVHDGAYHFHVHINGIEIKDLILKTGGLHNVENAIAAIAVAAYLNIAESHIRCALQLFRGVKRRFEFVLSNTDSPYVLIDDYAHHPEELSAVIKGVRSLYNEQMLLVFQPHLYSRTKDLAAEFAASLDQADEVILLPVYPARELPVEGVSSALIAEKMKNKNCSVLTKEAFTEAVRLRKPGLIVMCGAGDIGEMQQTIKTILLEK